MRLQRLLCSCLFLLFNTVVFAQEQNNSVIQDLDGDGKMDSVFYREMNAQIIVKLSTRGFQSIKSPENMAQELNSGIYATKNGFEFYVHHMRAGQALQFGYEKSDKKVRLIGMSRYELGSANNDGSGASSINLLTNQLVGSWNYWDENNQQLIELPEIKARIEIPKTFLSELDGSVFDLYLSKDVALYEQHKEDFLRSESRRSVDEEKENSTYDLCWKGFLGKDIPVFLHFHPYNNIAYLKNTRLVAGNIVYLNTQSKTPIPVIGYVNTEGDYRLYEFASDGDITGLIEAKIEGERLSGVWNKPRSNISYSLHLKAVDSALATKDITAVPDSIFGAYYYQYTDKGYLGELTLKKINEAQASFYMFSVTSAPARNMADLIDNDTIPIPKPVFTYAIPGTGKCKIHVQFFKGFALVTYPPDANCVYSFGANATYEGIYFKLPMKNNTSNQ